MTRRIISLLLVICMVVGLMPMSVLAQEIAISNMVLDCPYVVHEHTEECYDESGSLVCGQVDYVFHEHDDYCYDSDGNLVCLLDEVEEHVHNLNDCYDENSRLVCEYVNVDAHQHNFGCFRGLEAKTTDEIAMTSASDGISPLYINGVEYEKDDVTGADKFYTGNDPWDENDEPGNDSSPYNKIVRSFDKISYVLRISRNTRDGSPPSNLTDSTRLYFQMTLNCDISEAKFDLDQFAKFYPTGDNGDVIVQYNIEFLDKYGTVVATQNHNGTITDIINSKTYSDINALINNNNDSVESSEVYRNNLGIVSQRFTGYQDLDGNKPGYSDVNAGVMVLAAKNGKEIQPIFKLWIEGNENNYSDYNNTESNTNTFTPEIVTVSATNNYNMQLLPNYLCNELGWYDFDKGVEVKLDTEYIDISVFEQDNIEDILKSIDVEVFDWANIEGEFAPHVDAYEFVDALGQLECNKAKVDPSTYLVQGKVLDGVNTDTTEYPLPDSIAEKFKYYRYGRMRGYGVTLQLHQKATYTDVLLDENYPDQKELARIKEKGIRGCTLPEGEFSFDIKFETEVKQSSEPKIDDFDPNIYTPILWDYNENISTRYHSYSTNYNDGHTVILDDPTQYDLGNLKRNIHLGGNSYYAYNSAASNYRDWMSGCYYGGDWGYLGMNGEQPTGNPTSPSPLTVNGNGGDTKYSINISDFDFDFAFNNDSFPERMSHNGLNGTKYAEYEKCFSAGYFQVLSVFPRVDKVSVLYETHAVIDNLELTSLDEEPEVTPIGSDVEARLADNKSMLSISLFTPGNITKRNTFNSITYYPSGYPSGLPTQYHWNGFLGTKSDGINYDSTAYAGDEIAIIGSSGIANTTDNIIYTMEHVQLFDSRALSLIEDKPPEVFFIDNFERYDYVEGRDYTVQFRYVVDGTRDENNNPIYKDGYDTNAPGVLEHMNQARIYYEGDNLKEGINVLGMSTSADKNSGGALAGYERVGVYAYIKFNEGVNFTGRMYLKIPVKVNDQDSDLVGKTVATVNFAHIDNENLRKQQGGTGWVTVINNTNSPYTKVEYDENNMLMSGSNNHGPVAGNSLLILDYNTKIGIKTTKTTDSNPTPQYDLDMGSRKVEYVLYNISTKASNKNTDGTHEKKADLNLRVNIDVTKSSDTTKQTDIEADIAEHLKDAENYDNEDYTPRPRRLTIYESDEIRMIGDVYAVDEATAKLGESLDSIDISFDKDNPTSVGIKSGNEEFVIKVYAVIDPDGYGFELNIIDAPVGITMPEVKFIAHFNDPDSINLGEDITARAYIKTEDDLRAYTEGKNNNAKTVIRAYRNEITGLSKIVDKKYIELDDEFTYTISYKNDTKTYDDDTPVYMYDLLPYNGDGDGESRGQGSNFNGGFADVKPEIYLNDVDVNGNYKVSAYYSTVPVAQLSGKFKALKEKGTVSPEDMITLINETENGFTEYELSVQKYDSQLAYECSTEEEIDGITCVLIKVTPLEAGSTVVFNLNVDTKNNEAADLYVNTAQFVIADKSSSVITAGTPITRVVSRSISGVAWHDENKNGKRDDGERLLSDVSAKLFVEVESGIYKRCIRDIRGVSLNNVTTDGNGAYIFENLPAGNYVVLFTGSILDKFVNATDYQKGDVAIDVNNDSKQGDIQYCLSSDGDLCFEVLYAEDTEDEIANIKYISKYSDSKQCIELHSAETIAKNGTTYKDEVKNIDLGLVTEDRFPITGGSGVIPFIFGGALLMIASMIAGLIIFSTKKKQIIK